MNTNEKKHKEEIIRATQLWECGDITRENLEYIFPELAESEDEKTRKELIQFIKNWKDPNNIGRPHDFPTLTRNVEQCDRYIAWLEKQKEFVSANFDDVWDTADCDELTAPLEKYSKDAIKEMCHAWYDKGIELERKSWLEKQGVQKQDPCEHCKDKCLNCHNFPCITKREFERDKSGMEVIKEEKVDNADKAKPKFKIGDWVVLSTSDGEKVVQIDSVQYFTKDGYPSYITTEGRWFGKGTKARLLTDKDVKITTIPESKAIVNKIKSWSEEDEEMLNHIIGLLEGLPNLHNWLKSLKGRVQPQPKQEWSEYDECYMSECIGAIATKYKGWMDI